MFLYSHILPICLRNKSFLFVLAPSTKVKRSVLVESCFAKMSSGAVPVPPPTIRALPLVSVNYFQMDLVYQLLPSLHCMHVPRCVSNAFTETERLSHLRYP